MNAVVEESVPLLAWCTLRQAVEWVELRTPPVDFQAEEASIDLVGRIAFTPCEKFSEIEPEGRRKIYALVREGRLDLRGYPAIGFRGVGAFNGSPNVLYDELGKAAEAIPSARVIQAGNNGHSGGWLWCREPGAEGWAYGFIEVNMRQLLSHFPPSPGQMYCLDGQPLLPSASPEKPVDPRRSVKKDAPVSTAVAKRSDGVLCYDHPNRRLRTLEAASYLGLSKSTLEKYRLTGEGPKFAKLGKTCTYSLADLDDWVEARTRTSTSEPR